VTKAEMSTIIASIDDFKHRIAEFFCEDKQKLEIGKMLSRLLKFTECISTMAKVQIKTFLLIYIFSSDIMQ